MGLYIKNYNYNYRTLHRLRQLALDYEGINISIFDFYKQEEITTKFKQFIIHSDCEGFYISKSSKQYEKIKKEYCEPLMIGDLDELKKEVQELNDYMLQNTQLYLKDAWIDFYNDVMSSRKILKFH